MLILSVLRSTFICPVIFRAPNRRIFKAPITSEPHFENQADQSSHSGVYSPTATLGWPIVVGKTGPTTTNRAFPYPTASPAIRGHPWSIGERLLHRLPTSRSVKLGMKDIQKIADALTAVIRLIVDKPDEMSLTIVPDGSGWMFRVSVSSSDVGMLIGKQGRIARSLRIILMRLTCPLSLTHS